MSVDPHLHSMLGSWSDSDHLRDTVHLGPSVRSVPRNLCLRYCLYVDILTFQFATFHPVSFIPKPDLLLPEAAALVVQSLSLPLDGFDLVLIRFASTFISVPTCWN